MFNFNNWFWDKLSDYFKENDNNQDLSGKGLYERYLSIFGEDLDEYIIPLLSDHVEIVDPIDSQDLYGQINPDVTPDNDKFLNHIAYTLGNPLDLTSDEHYRRVLSYVISLYKIKGTIPSYKYWANILLIDIDIIEIPDLEVRYDSGFTYDSEVATELATRDVIYDTVCPTCSDYLVVINNATPPGSNPQPNDAFCTGVAPVFEITDDQLQLLYKVIEFNEPINAKCKGVVYGLTFCDEIPACMEEEITLQTITGGTYDFLSNYDEVTEYDENVQIVTETITQTCPIPENSFDSGEFDTDEFTT